MDGNGGPWYPLPRMRVGDRGSVGRTLLGVATLAAIVWAALLLDLGRPAFWDPGEGRYAEAVREMQLTGRWLQPTLEGERYADKPPTFFWLVAGAFQLLGQTEEAARLPSAIAGILTIALTVRFGWRRIGPRAALGAGAILATAALFVALARSVRMDALLTLLLTATLFQVYTLWTAGRGRPRTHTWPIYILPALGLLVKGPIAVVLPALVVATVTLVTGERARLARLRPGAGAVAAILLIVAWYGTAAVLAPDYLASFIWRHNVGRFFRASSGHAEPLWYYLWVLPVSFLPWSLFLPGALVRAVHRARRGRDCELFLLAWCGTILVFFTLSQAKLATYLLPLFPPLALLVAAWLAAVVRAPRALRERALRIPAYAWIGGMVAVAIGTPTALAVRHPSFAVPATAALLLLAFPVLAWRALASNRSRRVPALVLGGALAVQVLFYRVGAPIVNEFVSLRSAAHVAAELPPTTPVFSYKTRGHSFSYYAGLPLTRVRSPEAAARVLDGAEPAALLTKAKYFERLQRQLKTPVCIWWQGPSGRVLLANVPRPDLAHAGVLTPLAPADPTHASASRPPRC